MGIIAWIVLGLIAGLIARAVYPVPQPGGVIVTILLGIIGAFIGGWVGRGLGATPYYSHISFVNIVWAAVGAILVLFLWSLVSGRRRPLM